VTCNHAPSILFVCRSDGRYRRPRRRSKKLLGKSKSKRKTSADPEPAEQIQLTT
jgi:hypothetical protein